MGLPLACLSDSGCLSHSRFCHLTSSPLSLLLFSASFLQLPHSFLLYQNLSSFISVACHLHPVPLYFNGPSGLSLHKPGGSGENRCVFSALPGSGWHITDTLGLGSRVAWSVASAVRPPGLASTPTHWLCDLGHVTWPLWALVSSPGKWEIIVVLTSLG